MPAKTEAKPKRPVPGIPLEKDHGGPEILKAKRQARLAAAKQAVIDAAGPLRPLPEVLPTLLDDMRRAWLVEEHPLDGPGVRELRKICKTDFGEFMKLYRAEEARAEARAAAQRKSEGGAEKRGWDGGEERVVAAIRELTERLMGEPGEGGT